MEKQTFRNIVKLFTGFKYFANFLSLFSQNKTFKLNLNYKQNPRITRNFPDENLIISYTFPDE